MAKSLLNNGKCLPEKNMTHFVITTQWTKSGKNNDKKFFFI